MGITRINSRIEESKRVIDHYKDELSKTEGDEFNNKFYQILTEVRANLYEEQNVLNLNAIDLEEAKSRPPLVTIHGDIHPRSEFIADYDGSGAHDSATKYLAKLIAEKNEGKAGKSIDDLSRDLEEVGKARGEFSNLLLKAQQKQSWFSEWRKSLWRLKSKWQDFFSTHVSMHVEDFVDISVEYSSDIIKNPEYLRDGFMELPILARSLNIKTSVASQNLFPFIAPITYPLGWDMTLANNVMIDGKKIYIPKSKDSQLNIITAADKHGLIQRMRKYIEEKLSPSETKKADFFPQEAEGFHSTFSGDFHSQPRFGLEKSYLFESESELGGDAFQSIKGMLKPENIESAFLVKSEGSFDSRSDLGQQAQDRIRELNTDINFVDDIREAMLILQNRIQPFSEYYATRGLIGHTRIVEDFQKTLKGEMRIDDLLKSLPKNDRDENSLRRDSIEETETYKIINSNEGSVKELVRSRERALWLIDKLVEHANELGHDIDLDEVEKELDGRIEVDYTFPTVGIPYHINYKKLREDFFKRITGKARHALEIMEDVSDTRGTRMVLHKRDSKMDMMNKEDKIRFIQD